MKKYTKIHQLSENRFLNLFKLDALTDSGRAFDYFFVSRRKADKIKLLTKDMIIEHVWNEDGESTDDNNLFVRINRLRQKVETDPKIPKRIVTIRGMGYIWRED